MCVITFDLTKETDDVKYPVSSASDNLKCLLAEGVPTLTMTGLTNEDEFLVGADEVKPVYKLTPPEGYTIEWENTADNELRLKTVKGGDTNYFDLEAVASHYLFNKKIWEPNETEKLVEWDVEKSGDESGLTASLKIRSLTSHNATFDVALYACDSGYNHIAGLAKATLDNEYAWRLVPKKYADDESHQIKWVKKYSKSNPLVLKAGQIYDPLANNDLSFTLEGIYSKFGGNALTGMDIIKANDMGNWTEELSPVGHLINSGCVSAGRDYDFDGQTTTYWYSANFETTNPDHTDLLCGKVVSKWYYLPDEYGDDYELFDIYVKVEGEAETGTRAVVQESDGKVGWKDSSLKIRFVADGNGDIPDASCKLAITFPEDFTNLSNCEVVCSIGSDAFEFVNLGADLEYGEDEENNNIPDPHIIHLKDDYKATGNYTFGIECLEPEMTVLEVSVTEYIPNEVRYLFSRTYILEPVTNAAKPAVTYYGDERCTTELEKASDDQYYIGKLPVEFYAKCILPDDAHWFDPKGLRTDENSITLTDDGGKTLTVTRILNSRDDINLYTGNDGDYYVVRGYKLTSDDNPATFTVPFATIKNIGTMQEGTDDLKFNFSSLGFFIGTKGYPTIEAAMEAAKSGDTIALKKNVVKDIVVNKNITLAGGGKCSLKGVTLESDASMKGLTVTGIGVRRGSVDYPRQSHR